VENSTSKIRYPKENIGFLQTTNIQKRHHVSNGVRESQNQVLQFIVHRWRPVIQVKREECRKACEQNMNGVAESNINFESYYFRFTENVELHE
jgi:hypothetical protein